MSSNVENVQSAIARIASPLPSPAMMSTPSKALRARAAIPGTPVTGSTPRLAMRTPSHSNTDRFIPNREGASALAAAAMSDDETPAVSSSDFSSQLAQSLFEGESLNSKVLAFKTKAPKPQQFDVAASAVYSANASAAPKRAARFINPTPERVLDAPQLVDDYYLNLLDWSSQNMVAIALGNAVYMWNPLDGTVDMLCEQSEETTVTSVQWMGDGSHLAIGTSDNDVQMWNLERRKKVRTMLGHSARVSALAWNGHVLTSGSRDSNIFHHDVRVAQHHFGTLKGHEQEICGLKWNAEGTQLASGGNDNMCAIWDVTSSGSARHTFTDSSAAVKALAWCPWQRNTLATGSGTADRHIRFYDTQAGSMINKIDTGSQVCSLIWSTTEKELLSSHGFSQNQLTVWKFPSLVKVADLTGHSARVLHTALSPDGTTVVSAAADETMRFWNVWESAAQKQKRRQQQEAAGASATACKSSMMALKLR